MPFGSNDFLEYWSAFQAFVSGANPYDADVLLAIQRTIKPELQQPILMWNPPWLLILLAPLLIWSFETARILWLLASGLATVGAGVFIARRFSAPRWTILFFFPTYASLQLGQLGGLLILGAALLFVQSVSQNKKTCGLLLFTLKPHLFLLVWADLAIRAIRGSREAWSIVARLFTVLLLGSIAVEIIRRGTMADWIQSFSMIRSGAVNARQWMNASFVDTFSRYLDLDVKMQLVSNILLILAAVLAVLVQSRKDRFALEIYLAMLLVGSFLVAPFAWVFDGAILFPAVCFAVSGGAWFAAAYLALQGGAFFFHAQVAGFHHEYAWVTLSLCLLFVVRIFSPRRAI